MTSAPSFSVPGAPGPYAFTKHHGLGNDFLVALGPRAALAGLGPDQARRWCDRHRGIGADGLLLGATDDPDSDLVMTLYNADGSLAEMSGNGIRCLAQAELLRRGDKQAELHVLTGGGPRTVAVGPDPGGDPWTVKASVDMGEVRVVDLDPSWAKELRLGPVSVLDAGNPHVVIETEPAGLDLAAVHEAVAAHFPEGVNVEVALGTDRDTVSMRVWERGVGETLACGTGACAVARALTPAGGSPSVVRVHQPGGVVEVGLDGSRATLIGPATLIARIEVGA